MSSSIASIHHGTTLDLCANTEMDAYADFYRLCMDKIREEKASDTLYGSAKSWLCGCIGRFWPSAHSDVHTALLAQQKKKKTFSYYKAQAALVAQNIDILRQQRLHHANFTPSPITRDGQAPEIHPETPVRVDVLPQPVLSAAARRLTTAMYGSLVLNVFLLAVKLFAVYLSRSLTVIASVLDSVLDIFSGCFLLLLSSVVRRMDARKYPIGTKRLEPLGVLIFSSIMASASLSVVQHCVASLYEHLTSSDEGITHSLAVVIIMEIVLVIKCAMFLYCRTLAAGDAIGEALVRDHRNDVLSNAAGLLGVVMTLLVHVVWDDVIGIAITLYIIVNWSKAAYAQMRDLSCKTAPHAIVNQIIFAALTHHPEVTAIEKVQVYSVGCGYHAEVDIVLPPEMALRPAHDIGESLQVFLEKQDALPIVRAYVHVDYETNHHTNEHR